MRLLTTILFLVTFSASWGQGLKFTYGGNNSKVFVLGDILFPKYATDDSSKVLGVDSNGNIVLRTKSGSGAGFGSVTTVVAGGYMLGGTITVAGTLTPDTSAGKLGTKTDLAKKVNYTDTPSMLAPYARKTQVPTNNNQLINGAGYITGYTETDPIFTASPAKNITLLNINDWNAASANGVSDYYFDIGTGNATISTVGGTNYNANLDGRYAKYTDTGSVYYSKYGVDTAKKAIRSQIPTNNNQLTNGSGYITGNQSITVSGDATGSGATSIPLTLATVNSNVGTFTHPSVTVDGKGRITAISSGSVTNGTVTNVSVTSANGFAGTVATSTTTPAITLTTTVNGLVKGNGTALLPASAGTDYQAALTGTGYVKSTAGAISYDNSTFLTTISGISAGGDLTGTYPSPAVAANAVTYAKMQAVSTTSRVLGSSASTTAVQELQLGTGLQLSGSTIVWKPRDGNTTSSATPTINTDNVDQYRLTAQAVDITSFTTNLSGTPVDGQTLLISITGTASRAITWGASFEASTIALPTTTSGTSMLSTLFIYNSVTSKWRCAGTW